MKKEENGKGGTYISERITYDGEELVGVFEEVNDQLEIGDLVFSRQVEVVQRGPIKRSFLLQRNSKKGE